MAKLPDPETPKAGAPAPTVGAPALRREHIAAASMRVPKAIGPVKSAPAPLGAARGPFWYCIHPLRWRVLEGQVVPDPKPLHGSPGANGVDRGRRDPVTGIEGPPNMVHAFHAQADQGWTVLDHEVGGPGTSYLQQIESTGGWTSIWTKSYPGSKDTSHNGKAEAAWWTDLIARGILEPCPLHVLTNMRRDTVRTLDQTMERNRPKDGARAKRLRSAIEAIDAELAKYPEAA
jgi:hypothetical protein